MPPKKRVLEETKSEGIFEGLVFSCSGTFTTTQSELFKKIESAGATTSKTVTLKVTHLVTTVDDYKKRTASVQKAIKQNIPIVLESYITKCIEADKKLPTKDYQINADDDDEEEEEESSEEEKEEEKPKKKVITKKLIVAKKKVEESSSEEESSSSEEEEEAPKKKRKTATTTTTTTTTTSTRSTRSSKKTETETEKTETVLKTNEEITSDLDDSDSDSDGEKHTVTIKGRAVVDVHFPYASTCHVYDDGKTVYDAPLNQTEISQNNNKFYIVQLLQSDDNKTFYCWNRWGREGYKGQAKIVASGTKDSCYSAFKAKFYEKTKNNWENRDSFVKYHGKYDYIKMDYSVDGADDDKKPKKKVQHKTECSLDTRVQDFIKLIFDVKMMKRTMVEAKFDLKKTPLGKLSKEQIKKGYGILRSLEDEINKSRPSHSVLSRLSSDFYTAIPHSFGFSTPPLIDNLPMLKSKLSLLSNLADIEIATALIKESESDDSNILESYYKQLKTKIVPLDTNGEEYEFIQKYVKNTFETRARPPTIINIFKIEREGESERFAKTTHLGNRKLLWHGSRLSNFVGIISQGLRIAPPEAPVSGYRFGKGIYFADIMSFSANYCRTSGDDFCMFLGDVSLGKTADLYKDTYMEKPQPNSHSTLALGTVEPDPKDQLVHKDGFIVPYGPVVPSPYKQTSCREHQYVVYNVDQVNLKYVLQLKY
eukprot:gene3746-4665_t